MEHDEFHHKSNTKNKIQAGDHKDKCLPVTVPIVQSDDELSAGPSGCDDSIPKTRAFSMQTEDTEAFGSVSPEMQHAGAVECSCVTGHSHRRVCLSNAIEYLGEKLRDFSA